MIAFSLIPAFASRAGSYQSSLAQGGSATTVTDADVTEPRAFGSGGGHGCYYRSCDSAYGAGGAGGGRIFISSAEAVTFSGAVISADGADGGEYAWTYCGNGWDDPVRDAFRM